MNVQGASAGGSLRSTPATKLRREDALGSKKIKFLEHRRELGKQHEQTLETAAPLARRLHTRIATFKVEYVVATAQLELCILKKLRHRKNVIVSSAARHLRFPIRSCSGFRDTLRNEPTDPPILTTNFPPIKEVTSTASIPDPILSVTVSLTFSSTSTRSFPPHVRDQVTGHKVGTQKIEESESVNRSADPRMLKPGHANSIAQIRDHHVVAQPSP